MKAHTNSRKWRLVLIATVAWFAFSGMRVSAVSGAVAEPPGAKKDAKKSGKTTKPTQSIAVLFSPDGGCTKRIITEIGRAKETIRVQAYSFTSAPIAKAILDAKKRGVACEVILDKSQESRTYSELDFFHNQGIPVFIDDRHAIAHNKIILVDTSTIITGSFNFSRAAEERNAENLLVFRGHDDLATKYARNYAEHKSHSREYKGRSPTTAKPRGPPKASTPPKTNKPVADDPEVYVTRTGSKYHADGCSYLRKSATPMKLSEAKGRYGPCSKCKPPT